MWMSHQLFNQSPISFLSIAVRNNTAMNNLVDTSFGKSVRMSVGSVPRIGAAGLKSTGISNSGRRSKLKFQFPGCFTPTQTKEITDQECLRRMDPKSKSESRIGRVSPQR